MFYFVCSTFPFIHTDGSLDEYWSSSWNKMLISREKNKKGKLEAHFSSKAHKSSLSAMSFFLDKSQRINIMLDKINRNENMQVEYEKLNFNDD